MTKEESLIDFRKQCLKIKEKYTGLECGYFFRFVEERLQKKECPFLDFNLEKDSNFRASRRFFRLNVNNGIIDEYLRIIREVENE